ncbi:MAG TPA: hypothetical protein VGO37_14155 [Steroidobacteraceae bacterium]|nr:hypothetical protein [Steroidobacteraceae bacterium]
MRSKPSLPLQPTTKCLVTAVAGCALILAGTRIGLAAPPTAPPKKPSGPVGGCLESGDGYLRATLGGAIETKIDWPNSGTRCQGEQKDKPPGVRLSFQRISGASLDLLFVFGITGIREGTPARATGVNLTVIVQGTNRIYGTLGDSRCTVDSLAQQPLKAKGAYRVEARGFCTQPAHAVRGNDAVLVSTFEFAGLVTYDAPNTDTTASGQTAAQ